MYVRVCPADFPDQTECETGGDWECFRPQYASAQGQNGKTRTWCLNTVRAGASDVSRRDYCAFGTIANDAAFSVG